MKVLITGGSGYLGSKLVKCFYDRGVSVVVISRNKKLLKFLPNFNPHNLFSWGSDSEILKILEGVDVVIHSAGMNYQDCIASPYAANQFNGVMTRNLVKLSSSCNVNKFIYISTAHVYGGILEGEVSERIAPNANNSYSISHLAGENAVIKNSPSSTMGIVARLSNAFGKPIHGDVACWELLINQLSLEAIKSNTITLKTCGLQKRDFIGISEVCDALYFLSSLDNHKVANPVFNIGSQTTRSVLDAAKIIQERCMLITGKRPRLIVSDIQDTNLNNHFIYKTENLNSLEYIIRDRFTEEIDDLLSFLSSNKIYTRPT